RNRRNVLERFRVEHGDKPIAQLEHRHLEAMVAAKTADTPGAALLFLVSVRALMRHAITAGLRADGPSVGVRRPKPKTRGGWYAWTEDDISKFEERHPVGTKAR